HRHTVAAVVDDQNVASIDSNARCTISYRDSCDHSAVARVQLHHRLTEEIRNPDAGPIKCKAEWTITHFVSTEHLPCCGELRHRVAFVICDEDVCPIGGQCDRTPAHRES